MSSIVGSGAGKGRGGGGFIRQSGGKMGERGAAVEEAYFRKEKEAQLKRLKEELKKREKQTN